jgi:N utilization substance protein A
MVKLKLNGDEIGCISTFQKLTNATARDCLINEDETITFVFGKEHMGLAIGKNGSHIKEASNVFKKDVTVVEYSEDPVKFIKNVMYPIRPKTINIEGKNSKKVAKISVDKKDRSLAIGSRGRNIHKLNKIVSRHHNIDDVKII